MLLLSWLTALYRRLTTQTVRRRPRGRRTNYSTVPAMVGALEPRLLLSAAPVGSEFKVNTYTVDNQGNFFYGQSVATDAAGNFVITWQSDGGQDGGGSGIFAQRYNAAGVAQGGEFLVNSTTTGGVFEGPAA